MKMNVCNENFNWHFDYVRLATDEGFHFGRKKAQNSDKNQICLIDVDQIVNERDVATVERCIPAVLDFILDSEQASLLDNNFVKTFRISQLVVEYLLFCKKYLDHTVVLLKQELSKYKGENKELDIFVNELKDHIATLTKKIQEQHCVVYKCEDCNKAFSSQEFLNSHKQRRHSSPNLDSAQDTDKLHLEIKELKGRLNSAERLAFKTTQSDNNEFGQEGDSKVSALQQSIENLKLQVETEMRLLRNQRSFEEKCERMLEVATHQLKSPRAQVPCREMEAKKVGTEDLEQKRESTTQTDRIENEKEHFSNSEIDQDKKEARIEMAQFEETLEIKVTSKLQQIENQMHSFLNKLNEIQSNKKSDSIEKSDQSSKPHIKPRSKFTIVERKDSEIQSINSEALENVKSQNRNIEQVFEKPVRVSESKIKSDTKMKQIPKVVYETESSSCSESCDISSQSIKNPKSVTPCGKPSLATTLGKPSVTSIKNVAADEEVLGRFQEEIEQIVFERLQDVGISPHWKGLPFKSYDKTLKIINHQSDLIKKGCPNFYKIREQIDKDVSQKAQYLNTKNRNQVKNKRSKKNPKHSTNDRSSKTYSKNDNVKSTEMEIKDRKMYESDTESESSNHILKQYKKINSQPAPYTSVVKELKALNHKNREADDLKDKKADVEKGVLKNAMPTGAINKKKVLFDLASKNDMNNRTIHYGGSTTSIASSVLDGSLKKDVPHHSTKEIEDLSDFDFSDI